MSRQPKGPGATPPPAEDDYAVAGEASPSRTKKGSPKNEVLFATVGEKIVRARKALHLTQAQLARAADIPVTTVFTAENGLNNTSLGTLQKIADGLKLELRDLLPGKDVASSIDEGLVMLKLVEGALQTTLTEMNRTTLMLRQVQKLIERLQGSMQEGEGEH